MKSQKVWNILSIVFWVLLVAAEVMVTVELLLLKMLPGKYFAIVVAVLALLALILGLMMRQKVGKYQSHVTHTRQIIAYILSVVIIACCCVGILAVDKVNRTVSAITKNPTISAIVNIYVRTDDPAQSIEDTAGYTFGYTEAYDAENSKATLEAIEEKLSGNLTPKLCDSVFAMIDALYAGDVDAIILNDSYSGILEEIEGYTDFAEKARLLYAHSIEVEVKVDPSTLKDAAIWETTPEGETAAPEREFDPTKDCFVLYINGNDARQAQLANGGSDVNILAVINPTAKQILMVNTPRDYYIPNPAGSGALDKLSHTGLYGIDCSVQALSDLYGVEIDYYAKINFTGFKTLVDAIGGVTVYIDTAFSTSDFSYSQGYNHLNGAQALRFARERKSFAGGDNTRGKNQMKLIEAMIDQLSASTILTRYSDILSSLEGMFTTSMPADTISSLVKMQLNDMASWEVLSYAVTGDNGKEPPYSLGGLYAYVMLPHEDKVAQASDLMARALNGEILTEADLESVG